MKSSASSSTEKFNQAMARSFIYRFIAHFFEYPSQENWAWTCDSDTLKTLRQAVEDLSSQDPTESWSNSFENFAVRVSSQNLEIHQADYHLAFGHAARGRCPMNEIEYNDIKADPLFQPHRLADLGAFYSAFGFCLNEEGSERQDHISLQCEFLSILSAKEALALFEKNSEQEAFCLLTQKKFIKEHPGRWVPAFSRRLAQTVDGTLYALIADFIGHWIERECRRLQVTPGNDDLLLRNVNEAEESLCTSCGVGSLPPGALHSNFQADPSEDEFS